MFEMIPTPIGTYPAPLASNPFGAFLDVARFLTFWSNAPASLVRDLVFSTVALFGTDDNPLPDASSAGFGTRSPLIGHPSGKDNTARAM